MKLTHMISGTKHRIEVKSELAPLSKSGAWAQITQPATLSLNRYERVVMVTEWSKNAAFPTPSRAYIVREYEMPQDQDK